MPRCSMLQRVSSTYPALACKYSLENRFKLKSITSSLQHLSESSIACWNYMSGMFWLCLIPTQMHAMMVWYGWTWIYLLHGELSNLSKTNCMYFQAHSIRIRLVLTCLSLTSSCASQANQRRRNQEGTKTGTHWSQNDIHPG